MESASSVVEFIIAGMHDQPTGRLNAQPHPIRDGMADVEEFHLERANVHDIARLNRIQLGLLQLAGL